MFAIHYEAGWCSAPALAAPSVRGDFDGDGRGDLAIGAPADSVSGQQAAGAVNGAAELAVGIPGGRISPRLPPAP